MMVYPAVFDPAEEGGYVATFPDFGFGGTQGDTGADAMHMAEGTPHYPAWHEDERPAADP